MTEDGPGVDVLDELLRPLGLWVADIAERALPLFEARVPVDTRPRDAIEGIRRFGRGGRRTQDLRTLSWAAHAAARDAADPVARSAARAASLAAAAAYLHLDVASAHQIRHVLGPGVYGAQAREWAAHGDRAAGDAEIAWAVGPRHRPYGGSSGGCRRRLAVAPGSAGCSSRSTQGSAGYDPPRSPTTARAARTCVTAMSVRRTAGVRTPVTTTATASGVV
jgi:hypothetical protein